MGTSEEEGIKIVIEKRFFLFYVILGIFMIIPIGLFLAGNLYYTDIRLIERDWNITIPKHMQLEYKSENKDWFGEGIKYIAFRLETEPVSFIADFSYKRGKFSQIDRALSELRIPFRYLPDWSDEYYWKRLQNGGYLYILYYPNTLRLLFCEIRE
jgi:hypothetical protein